jgi:hypothetical protein
MYKNYRYTANIERVEMNFFIQGSPDEKMVKELGKLGFPVISFDICDNEDRIKIDSDGLFSISFGDDDDGLRSFMLSGKGEGSTFEISFDHKALAIKVLMEGEFHVFDALQDSLEENSELLGDHSIFCWGICPRNIKEKEIKFPKDEYGMRTRCEAISGTYHDIKYFKSKATITRKEIEFS